MKRNLIIIWLFLAAPLAVIWGADSITSPLTPARTAELLKAREAIWRALFANDIPAIDRLMSPNVIAINNDEDKWEHRADILEASKQFVADGGKLIQLSFPKVEIQSFGPVAVVYSQWSTEFDEKGQRKTQSGRATEIFVREDGQWLNAGWHLDSGK